MIKITKKIIIIFSVFVVVVVVAGFFIFDGGKKPSYELVEAKRGNIIQEVSITGVVKPSQSVDLAFEKGGRIANIYVKISDKVKSGHKLMELDTASLRAQLLQAEAELESARAQFFQFQAAFDTEKARLE